MSLKLSEFNYSLPKELIAQQPLKERDKSRLLILNRRDKSLREANFKDIIIFLREGDVLVLNDTKVIPARFFARRKTGAKLEVLLLKEKKEALWEALIRPARRLKIGEFILLGEEKFQVQVLKRTEKGTHLVRFPSPCVRELLEKYGKIPLPLYIRKEIDPCRYQTIYAKKEGAVASPTAGLHFTKELLKEIALKGIEIVYVTLHCGLATFRPLKTENIEEHKMDTEFYEIKKEAAGVINKAKKEKRRIIAVGTTVVRTLEAASFINKEGIGGVIPKTEETDLYIYPGYKFKIIDCLITNFHLPSSTNLILVNAFAGIEFIRQAYKYAIERKFRFYSFGDAMLIL